MRHNDDERRLWVENDELLYTDWEESGEAITTYVRKRRKQLDAYIEEKIR